MQRSYAVWKANSIAFISSFCVMVIELIAARILAPHIGVSLYTWTSIIGVILAGIALGNYLGGRIADRYASPTTLAIIFFAGGLTTIGILPATKLMASVDWFGTLPLMANFTLKVSVIFFVPAIILSMVSPLVIKLTLADLGRTGGVVGTIYAFSTAGSILGTFMTGFFLIIWFGARTIVWLAAIVLIATGILSWFLWRGPGRWSFSPRNIAVWALSLAVIGASAGLFQFRDEWQENYTRESNYYSIRIINLGGARRVLSLDHLLHSYVNLDDPKDLTYPYLRIFEEIVRYLKKDAGAHPMKFLHLGGGGYSFPRYLEVVYPGTVSDVVEIDPAVTEVAYQYLGLPANTSVKTYNQDARLFMIQGGTGRKYDIIIGDVFNDYSTPFHLTTVEFDRMVKSTLEPNGIYLVNVIDNYRQGRYMVSIIHTLRQVFKNVYLFGAGEWAAATTATFVLIATDRQIDLADFKKFTTENGTKTANSNPHDEAGLTELVASRDPALLTDDYTPTDILVARILK